MKEFHLSAILCSAWICFGSLAHAQVLTTLYSFCADAGCTDGQIPQANLVQSTNGDLYGTSSAGGAYGNGGGTIFKVTQSGTFTTLYSFCAQDTCPDGEQPEAGLVQATTGYLYGTTQLGGAYSSGTVFQFAARGARTTLYSFCPKSGCTDGEDPQADLIQATNGDFYGTTAYGGANGEGTVFRITPGGTRVTLYSFCEKSGCADGEAPLAGLIQATNGYFYGTTAFGGAYGGGTVFRLAPTGALTTLYSFCAQSNCPDGEQPQAGLLQASNGYLYGMTLGGGAHGAGAVFNMTPSGTLKTLYSFCSKNECTDGKEPYASLIQVTNGTLYGTTESGGASGEGVIFKMTLGGIPTTVYSFCAKSGCTDGDTPEASLLQATNGKLYGTTASGGAHSEGTVFEFSIGLGPFVKTLPTSGKVGAAVELLGTNLTGATAVTFHGTAAAFTVLSASEIKTTVPTGATTGTVEVTTPSGTLSSNVAFRVP